MTDMTDMTVPGGVGLDKHLISNDAPKPKHDEDAGIM